MCFADLIFIIIHKCSSFGMIQQYTYEKPSNLNYEIIMAALNPLLLHNYKLYLIDFIMGMRKKYFTLRADDQKFRTLDFR